MEAFSLLKYWKGNRAGARVRVSDGGGVAGATHFPVASAGGRTTTILAAVADHAGDFDSDPDEGPFFDLEFAVPADEDVIRKLESENSESIDEEGEEDEEDEEEEGEEIEELRQSPSTSSCENSEHNASLSPSDGMLFKGRIIHIDGTEDEEVNSKSGQFQMPASILRSATKFRVMMLKLKRSKSELTKSSTKSQQPKQNQQNNRKLFTVKFKVEEVPVIPLLSRASSNSKTTTTAAGEEQPATAALDSDEEISNGKKEVMQKYLKLVKPLYIRVSKRNNQQPAPETKEKAADEAAEEVKEEIDPATAVEKSEVKAQKAVVGLNLKGMMMAKKHLGKSKSAVVHSHSQSLIQNLGSKKSDDSLLQQQDWIQGAILHCKRSFNSATQDVEEEKEDGSMLTRSASDPSHEKKRTTPEAKQNDVVGV